MPVNKQFVLASRPTGNVEPGNFRLVETPVPTPGPGQILVRHHYLSLDPYMRGRLNDSKSYVKPQEVGAVMGGARSAKSSPRTIRASSRATRSSAWAAGRITR
jgi:NADPH-dependent curcumin reductase CurA